jgi:hypothetical protein
MVDRERLGDHPAHRHADHVGLLDVERVEQAGGVGGHVTDAVLGRDGPAAQHRLRESEPVVGGVEVNSVDNPMSRLSNRITRKPRATSSSTNPSGQSVSCPLSPITRRSGSPSPMFLVLDGDPVRGDRCHAVRLRPERADLSAWNRGGDGSGQTGRLGVRRGWDQWARRALISWDFDMPERPSMSSSWARS